MTIIHTLRRGIVGALLGLAALAAWGQSLTTQQITTLRAAVFADTTAAALLAGGNASGLQAYLNNPAVPTFVVWRTAVPIDDIMRNAMDWARVDNLSVGKARIWDWMGRLGSLDCSKANIRAGIDATWVGTAADLAVRSTVYTHCKRAASAAERMLATGTGTDAVPGTMGFEGVVSELDARRLVFKDDGTIWTP